MATSTFETLMNTGLFDLEEMLAKRSNGWALAVHREFMIDFRYKPENDLKTAIAAEILKHDALGSPSSPSSTTSPATR